MKFGVKKLILTALFICSSAFAQSNWNEDAWPSETSYKFSGPSSYFISTSYWANLHLDSWVATSWTNYVPFIYEDIGMSGQVSNRYGTNLSFVSLSYLNPALGSSTSAVATASNQYLTEIKIPSSTNEYMQFGYIASFTNDYVYSVTGAGTNAQANIISLVLDKDYGSTNPTLGLDIQWIWGHDTYYSLLERGPLAGDNIPEGPTLYKEDRDNLTSFKDTILDSLSSYVNTNLMMTNENFNEYLSTPNGWHWATTGNITNDNQIEYKWQLRDTPDSLPVMSKPVLLQMLTNLPREEVIEQEYSSPSIYGWEVYEATGSQQWLYVQNSATNGLVTIRTNYYNTWFDYTPYRDLGGWADGLSHTTTGRHEMPFSLVVVTNEAVTNSVSVFDTCGNEYIISQIATNNASYEITVEQVTNNLVYLNSFEYSSDDYPYVLDGLYTSFWDRGFWGEREEEYNGTNYLFIGGMVPEKGPYEKNTVSVHRVENSFGEVFSGTYFNSIVFTNGFVCTNDFIAEGYNESDYGYKHIPSIVGELKYFALDGEIISPRFTTNDLPYWSKDWSSTFGELHSVNDSNLWEDPYLDGWASDWATNRLYDGTNIVSNIWASIELASRAYDPLSGSFRIYCDNDYSEIYVFDLEQKYTVDIDETCYRNVATNLTEEEIQDYLAYFPFVDGWSRGTFFTCDGPISSFSQSCYYYYPERGYSTCQFVIAETWIRPIETLTPLYEDYEYYAYFWDFIETNPPVPYPVTNNLSRIVGPSAKGNRGSAAYGWDISDLSTSVSYSADQYYISPDLSYRLNPLERVTEPLIDSNVLMGTWYPIHTLEKSYTYATNGEPPLIDAQLISGPWWSPYDRLTIWPCGQGTNIIVVSTNNVVATNYWYFEADLSRTTNQSGLEILHYSFFPSSATSTYYITEQFMTDAKPYNATTNVDAKSWSLQGGVLLLEPDFQF